MRRKDFLRGLIVAGAAGTLAPGDAAARLARGASGAAPPYPRGSRRLDEGWRFLRDDVADAASPALDDAGWRSVVLPHTANVEALVTGEPGSPTAQWQGVCWYRRPLEIPADAADKVVLLRFEAAMNVADVFLDGVRVGGHEGGWLPFVLDLTDRVRPGVTHLLAVRLDNTDNAVTGPKPLADLDFNTYGGLYRYVHLVVKDRLHVTDPILADVPAGGGVFVTFPEVSTERAIVQVKTHVRNSYAAPREARVRTTLTDADGRVVASETTRPQTLAAGAAGEFVQRIPVAAPRLWSPAAPNRYLVRTELVDPDGAVVDAEETRVGIRRIRVTREGGFEINGERLFLRGTNRHQEYPYVGYAVPEAAQYRDARLIKDAGFDYIRLSHYPHAPAFMDACDELGIVVMDCLPGWQYFGRDPRFAELQYRNTRDLIRRDRNHPCVVLWEVSLNETGMPPEFIERTQAIAHEEYPGDQMITCGWMHGYDVYIRARQHGGCPPDEPQPCIVSEYGDWEYYAMTAGLNQTAFEKLTFDEANSRQLRWNGERAQLQQAANFQEAHDDNRAGPAFGDGLWVMFDYDRGYAPDIESSGCADIFRLPKYSYRFFRSQRGPDERLWRADSGPMVFLATEWTADSPTDVRVFSNCEEVELRLNGRTLARRRPDTGRMCDHLAHPPFTFRGVRFAPGELEAIGLLGGRAVARHAVRTPGPVERLRAWADRAGRPVAAHEVDTLFCHAALEDARGTVVASAWENVAFGATGDVSLVGANPFSSDAGIASIVARTTPGATRAAVYALAIVGGGASGSHGAKRAAGAVAPLLGDPSPFETSLKDGRARLTVDGKEVATLREDAEKFRIRGSEAPEKRQPYRRG